MKAPKYFLEKEVSLLRERFLVRFLYKMRMRKANFNNSSATSGFPLEVSRSPLSVPSCLYTALKVPPSPSFGSGTAVIAPDACSGYRFGFLPEIPSSSHRSHLPGSLREKMKLRIFRPAEIPSPSMQQMTILVLVLKTMPLAPTVPGV